MIITTHTTEAEWLEDRWIGVGSSTAAAVCGASNFSGEWAEFEHKVNRSDNFVPNEMTEAGHRMEKPISEWFQEQHPGIDLRDPGDYTICRSEEYPMYCTPDRHIGPLEPGTPPVEIKCVFNYAESKRWQHRVTPAYQVQIQHQMSILGSSHAYVAVLLLGYQFRYFRLNRNDRFIKRFREACCRFWDRVERRDPPPIDSREDTKRALSRYYDQPKPERVQLDYTLWDTHERLQKTKSTLKKLGDIKTECENKLKAAIGNAELGILHDCETAYHWRPPTSRGANSHS